MNNPVFTLDFWMRQLDNYRSFGLLAPVFLAALEALIPPLPLVAIVTLNIAAHGTVLGVAASWIGTCIGCTIVFFFVRIVLRRLIRRMEKRYEVIRKAERLVETVRVPALFTILIMPFTPSAFVNFAFGMSEYSPRTYLLTLYAAKLIMIALLGLFGESFVRAFDNPLLFIVAIGIIVVLYILSKKISEKHRLD